VFGFACQRILRDRRISDATKAATARFALGTVRYGADGGVPFAFLDVLRSLATFGALSCGDLRFGLVATAADNAPFRGLTRVACLGFMQSLLGFDEMPSSERLLWAHSLLARTGDAPTSSDMVSALLRDERHPLESRLELCNAWLHCRQPHLLADVPTVIESSRDAIVAEHMGFWIAHTPSWPTPSMVRLGLVWLAHQCDDVAELARTYVLYRGPFESEIKSAVIQILEEFHATMRMQDVEAVIEAGIGSTGATALRRKFYGVGIALYGQRYLERASCDTANSVRQWAVRQKQKLSQ
jgi:hypothetical protein